MPSGRFTYPLSLACLACLLATPAAPQGPLPPSETAKTMPGAWELSNSERDRTCLLTFRLDATGPGRGVILEAKCAPTFPLIRDTAAWTMTKDDSLRLVDAKGQVLVEFTEVEAGMFEAIPPNDTRLMLQTLAAVGAKQRIADDMFGDWSIVRIAGRPVCQLTFANTAHDADSFALAVKPGCDQAVTRFAPVAWKLDRGQLVMLSAKGDAWRFEENEPNIWSRIPAARPPMVMVRP